MSDLHAAQPIVFTAQSRHLYYARMLICAHAFEQGAVPINPFNAFGYFLHDLVERDRVRQGNNNLLRVADALWVYGPIADGVWAEIRYAQQLGKPIRFFSAGPRRADFAPLKVDELVFEDGVPQGQSPAQARAWLRSRISGDAS